MRYHNITKDDMLNGDGLRVVLWVSGCNHYCKKCQNPLTWDPNGGIVFDQQAKAEVFEELSKSYISGITFSGGDPLYSSNREEVESLIREIKQKFPDKTIWLYTGSKWEEVCHLAMMPFIDVLIDGKYECDKRNSRLHWRGSSNQRVINVPESLASKKLVLHCE